MQVVSCCKYCLKCIFSFLCSYSTGAATVFVSLKTPGDTPEVCVNKKLWPPGLLSKEKNRSKNHFMTVMTWNCWIGFDDMVIWCSFQAVWIFFSPPTEAKVSNLNVCVILCGGDRRRRTCLKCHKQCYACTPPLHPPLKCLLRFILSLVPTCMCQYTRKLGRIMLYRLRDVI